MLTTDGERVAPSSHGWQQSPFRRLTCDKNATTTVRAPKWRPPALLVAWPSAKILASTSRNSLAN